MAEYCLKVKFTELTLVSTGGRSGILYRFDNPHAAIDFIYERDLQDKAMAFLMTEPDYWDARTVPIKVLQNSVYNDARQIWVRK